MVPKKISFDKEDLRTSFSMGDFILCSPDGNHEIELLYAGEPPHGDSYHTIKIDGNAFPGFAWGCHFSISDDFRYLAFSWMAKPIERKTIVVDLMSNDYFVLPVYVYNVKISWPNIINMSHQNYPPVYRFSGAEAWTLSR